MNIPQDSLANDLLKVASDLGGTPRVKDYKEFGEYSPDSVIRSWGTWNNALKELGLEVNHTTEYTKSDLIKEIKRLASDGEPPTTATLSEKGQYSVPLYHKKFGSLNEAFEEAGFERRVEVGKRIEKICEECGDSFQVIPSLSEQRFCSQSCFGDHRTGKYTGEDHWRYRERVQKECSWCGDQFDLEQWRDGNHDNYFCSGQCMADFRSDNWGDTETLRYGVGWNDSKREQVREKYDRVCQGCGLNEEENIKKYDKKLAVHHITPAKKFEDPEQRNAIENLIPLCNDCHTRWEGIPIKPTVHP